MKITGAGREKYILIHGTHIGEVNKKLEDEFLFEMVELPNCQYYHFRDMQFKVKRNRCFTFNSTHATNN